MVPVVPARSTSGGRGHPSRTGRGGPRAPIVATLAGAGRGHPSAPAGAALARRPWPSLRTGRCHPSAPAGPGPQPRPDSRQVTIGSGRAPDHGPIRVAISQERLPGSLQSPDGRRSSAPVVTGRESGQIGPARGRRPGASDQRTRPAGPGPGPRSPFWSPHERSEDRRPPRPPPVRLAAPNVHLVTGPSLRPWRPARGVRQGARRAPVRTPGCRRRPGPTRASRRGTRPRRPSAHRR